MHEYVPQLAQLVPPLEDVVEPLLLLVVVPLELDVDPLDELLDELLDDEALLPLDVDGVVGTFGSLFALSLPVWGVLRSLGFFPDAG